MAARLGGVGPSTLFDWLRRGRAGEEPFSEFLERLKKAEAEFEATALGRIQKAAQEGTWTAAAWLLERRHPKRWAKRDREPAKPLDRSLDALTDAEVAERLERMVADTVRLDATFLDKVIARTKGQDSS